MNGAYLALILHGYAFRRMGWGLGVETSDPHVVIPHPEWWGRSVTLICGPPGSGKTTLGLRMHPRTLDIGELPPGTPRGRMRTFGRMAWRAGRSADPNLAVIRGAPTRAEREHQQQLCRPSRTIILLTDASVCHERVSRRNRSEGDEWGRGLDGQHAAIDEWWCRWYAENPPPAPLVSGYGWP